MIRRTFLRSAVLLGAFAAGVAASSPAAPVSATIAIDNFTFSPAEVTVAAGAEVTWTNRDDIPHLVVDAGNPRQFKSAPLDTGDHFSFVFAHPGTYHYFCALHPHMQGTVVVR